jgi:hypothetical protein
LIVTVSGVKRIKLWVHETRRCERCEKDRPFNVIVQYGFWALYGVFGFVTRKEEYFLVCDMCDLGWEIERSKIEPDLKTTPIPFMMRYGLLALAVTVAGAFVGAVSLEQFLKAADALGRAADTKACDEGNGRACFHLGLALEEGRGVAKDEARAVSA